MYKSFSLPPPLRSPSLFPLELYFSNQMPKHRTLHTKCQYHTFVIHHLHAHPSPPPAGYYKNCNGQRDSGCFSMIQRSHNYIGFNDQNHALTTTCSIEVVFVLIIKSINMHNVCCHFPFWPTPWHPSPPKHLFQKQLWEHPCSVTHFLRSRDSNLLSAPPGNKRTLLHPTSSATFQKTTHRSDHVTKFSTFSYLQTSWQGTQFYGKTINKIHSSP